MEQICQLIQGSLWSKKLQISPHQPCPPGKYSTKTIQCNLRTPAFQEATVSSNFLFIHWPGAHPLNFKFEWSLFLISQQKYQLL